MKNRILSVLLLVCMLVTMMPFTASAAATNISVTSANYYNNGDVKTLNINFGWDTASATSCLTVATKRLRSAGESGTDKYYGDFTDLGYYGTAFRSWDEVLSNADKFGMLYYTDEQKMEYNKTNSISLYFEEGDIPLDVNQTYYLYLWTYYGGHYYPDNLFMVLEVKNGTVRYASATDRNDYGKFTVLKSTVAATPEFQDVKKADYFFTPVNWAVEKGITNGTSATTFAPNATCTRAQILTFLWRAAGSPAPSIANPYTDVKVSDYYYNVALWAKEKGIYAPNSSTFGPNTPATRGATVEYFWRYAGAPSSTRVPFSDVSEDSNLDKAVSWALRKGITNGTGGTTFSPNATCTRAQIVTFLHRYFVTPLNNSDLITSLTKAATQTVTSMTLDPNPPEDYKKQPDWYGSLTPAYKMSDERLIAEYNNIQKIMDDFRARDIYMGDAIYSRELDLWAEYSKRRLDR
ncbi:MAG: S-layer homology domain-containing protein [Ruminococcaceae bacterium]|nr:S-layer homology domain-containing protein [Oscillospiraceae bacterium]